MRLFLLIFSVFVCWIPQYQSRCLNWCNKRGVCSSPQEGGNCICNMGFTGEDCSQRLCPADFDPIGLSEITNRKTVRLEIGHMGGVMTGRYAFGFAGSEVFLNAHAGMVDARKCRDALLKLESVNDVSCTRESFDKETGVGSYIITILSYPELPYMNNIITHNGNPGINLFNCNVSKIDKEEAAEPFCHVSISEPFTGFPLYAECSNHGNCNRVPGLCTCEKGFNGAACNDINDSKDIVVHEHDGPFFSATMLKVRLNTDTSSSALVDKKSPFNLFQAQLDDVNITTIAGDGTLSHIGNIHILSGALTVRQQQQRHPQFSNSDSAYHYLSSNIKSSLRQQGLRREEEEQYLLGHDDDNRIDAADHSYHILAYDDEAQQTMFAVTADGDVNIAGALDVSNGSLLVHQDRITGRHLRLTHDLEVFGAATIEDSLTIGSGLALTPGGMTVDVASHSGTLFELRSRQEGFNGSLLELHAAGSQANMLKAVSAEGQTTFLLSSSGDVKMQGLRLASGGVHVEAGGVQIDAGGLVVHGGLTIASGQLHAQDQMFTVAGLRAKSNADEITAPLLQGHVTNEHYAGSVLQLSVDPTALLSAASSTVAATSAAAAVVSIDGSSSSKARGRKNEGEGGGLFSFAKFHVGDVTLTKPVFEVTASGSIESVAGAKLGADLYVQGSTALKGDLSLLRTTIQPILQPPSLSDEGSKNHHYNNYRAVIPSTASYVVIASFRDTLSTITTTTALKGDTRVEVIFSSNDDDSEENGYDSNNQGNIASGRVVIITNMNDDITTYGAVSIPPRSTVLLVFDGTHWVDIEALKAPMHVLQNVQVLEADNDLNIGNHTLSARRFQASGLNKHSIVFAGEAGLLSQSDKFSYSKGVLSAPAMKIEKLLSNIDARGNEISNALLSRAKLTEATISAAEIILSGRTAGLAYFNTKGALSVSSTLALDSAGRLMIQEMYSDVNVHQHIISNVTVAHANISNAFKVSTEHLYVTSLDDQAGSLLMVSSPNSGTILDGKSSRSSSNPIVSTQQLLQVDRRTGVVKIPTLAANTLASPLNANDQIVSNINIEGGSISQLNSLETQHIVIGDLSYLHTAEATSSSSASVSRLVFVNAEGRLQSQSDSQSRIFIPNLSVEQLHFESNEVNFDGRTLSNVQFAPHSVQFGAQKELQIDTLTITGLNQQQQHQKQLLNEDMHGSSGSGKFLTCDNTGKISVISDIYMSEDDDGSSILDITSSIVETNTVIAKGITIATLPSAGVLSTDASGAIHGSNNLEIDHITAKKVLTIPANAHITMQGKLSSLLAVDENGVIVTVPSSSSNSNRNSNDNSQPMMDVMLHHIEVDNVQVNKSLVATKVIAQQLYITNHESSAATVTSELNDVKTNSNMLTKSQDGLVRTAMQGYLHPTDGTLYISGIEPLSSTISTAANQPSPPVVTVKSALLLHSNITSSHIHNSPSISTQMLVVHDIAEFYSDVVIDGSVTVHGTVIGSGPYVDSSDIRFKRNILPLENPLSQVNLLRGVTYNYRSEEFPTRKFPDSLQIGWIADEVQKHLPELVTTDSEGYKGIAYAHATVLVAAAVNELQDKHDAELAALRDEVRELRELVNKLLQNK